MKLLAKLLIFSDSACVIRITCQYIRLRRVCIKICIFLSPLTIAGTAAAVCANPAGEAGSIIFSTTIKTMQYCNGSDWINAGAVIPNAPQTGCTNPAGQAGHVIYANNRGVVQFCNGNSWVDTACAAGRKPNGSGCGGKPAGTIQYAANHNELQFCDSTDWVAMGWGCAGGSGPVIPAEQEVMAYVSSSTNNLVISSLFDGGDWADGSKRKKLIINSGVTVGSTAAGTPALRTGTGRVHSLIIVNNGTIAGAGGAANGGVGGNALLVEQVSVTVLNSGTLAGGGGGGGKGGTGGSGSVREPATGDSFNDSGTSSTRMWVVYVGYAASVHWADPYGPIGSTTENATSLVIGAYTYYRSTLQDTTFGNRYRIYRMSNTVVTGGAGGNGGRGQGSDGAATAGLTGAVGGTNAGAGGTGGAGGAYGAAGAAGGTGTAGNASSGLAGSAGGAAGGAITGSGYILTNTGTVLGSY